MGTSIASVWSLALALSLLVALLVCHCDATLSKSDKKSKKAKAKSEPIDEGHTLPPAGNVRDRDLVRSQVKPADILQEHDRISLADVESRQFNGPLLAYVTPWNSKGYDIAKTFRKKFTLVSPVWLQVTPKANGDFAMAGGHDIDSGWAKEVADGRDNVLVPRVLFDKWSISDYQRMFASEQTMGKCAKIITSFIKKHGFGGVTIEIWSQMPEMLKSDVVHFLIDLSAMLHQANKLIILVVPPLQLSPTANSPSFTSEHFDELKDSIDHFSIMTYDYHAQSGVAGPISPITWIEKSVTALCPRHNAQERAKLLIGLNFYGIKFSERSGAQPVIGHEFINILRTQKAEVSWQAKEAEHAYIYKDANTGEQAYLFYPSLMFLQERVSLAQRLGTGLAIWEIGQGLDYFYDLL